MQKIRQSLMGNMGKIALGIAAVGLTAAGIGFARMRKSAD